MFVLVSIAIAALEHHDQKRLVVHLTTCSPSSREERTQTRSQEQKQRP